MGPLVGRVCSSVTGSQTAWGHHNIPGPIGVPDLNVDALGVVRLRLERSFRAGCYRLLLRCRLATIGLGLFLHILLFKF